MAAVPPRRRTMVAVIIAVSLGLLPGCGGENSQMAPPPPIGSTPPPVPEATPGKGQSNFGSNAATDTTLDPRYR